MLHGFPFQTVAWWSGRFLLWMSHKQPALDSSRSTPLGAKRVYPAAVASGKRIAAMIDHTRISAAQAATVQILLGHTRPGALGHRRISKGPAAPNQVFFHAAACGGEAIIRVAMTSPDEDSNNARFRTLIDSSGLSLATAMTLFNRGLADPITESMMKAWLAAPGSSRRLEIPIECLQHAEKVFSKPSS